MMQTLSKIICILLGILLVASCGRGASRLLRQGQLPIYDFPLYLTDGVSGQLIKIDRDGNKEIVLEGLKDPRGVATDRFGNVYIAEYGANSLLKLEAGSKKATVISDSLSAPSIVAVDSIGDAYVTQDGSNNIVRGSDKKVFASFSSTPSAFAFGVNDIPIIGLFGENKVQWGVESETSVEVKSPSGISVDGTGRVYVSEGTSSGQVFRFHQRKPGVTTLVANAIVGPLGIAVDPVGNIFLVEQGAGRIVMISFEQIKYSWMSDLTDPQYIAFTQY